MKGLLGHGSADMSGALPTKRMLRTTAAAAAAGAVAFAPLSPLALEVGRGGDPLSISVGQSGAFTRVEFGGVVGARSRVRQDGDKVIVRLGVSAAPDVSRLRVDPPEGVKAVETRLARGGGTDLIITLAEGAQARSGVADGAVWLPQAPADAVLLDAPCSATGAANRSTTRCARPPARWPM